ncbi:MAG TPA: hypothetical protein VL996_11150 [Methylocella sp.]|nr:hypothetical protein [Methylocella sp.]
MSLLATPQWRSALLFLGIVLGFVPSPAPVRLRYGLLALGIALGLSGVWLSLSDLLSPKSTGLPFDRNGATAHRPLAVLAAEIGVIRGDLWAKAAFTGARFLWTDRPANLNQSDLNLLARVRSNAETALALAPINGTAWLFLAKLPAISPDAESRIGTLLEMSYFTAPSAPDLAPWRLQRAAASSALADKDIQAFVKSDLREMLNRRPDFQQAILAAYRTAWPQNQPIFESLVADIDPGLAQLLRSSQTK